MRGQDSSHDLVLRRLGGGEVRATLDPLSPLLESFFEGYDRAFILPDEKEDLAGFQACLALNPSERAGQGEVVAVVFDPEGVRLAGLNLLAVDHGEQGQPRVSVALNYIYVEGAARGQGMLRHCLSLVPALAQWALGLEAEPHPVVIFIEQNDPLRMTAQAYREDTAHSGLDQLARLAIWDRVGARLVDFDYVQPALSGGQSPDEGLAYAVIDWPSDALPCAFLHRHLERFFSISVLKGQPETGEAVADRQLTELAARDQPISLLSIGGALDALARDPSSHGASSLRQVARGEAADAQCQDGQVSSSREG